MFSCTSLEASNKRLTLFCSRLNIKKHSKDFLWDIIVSRPVHVFCCTIIKRYITRYCHHTAETGMGKWRFFRPIDRYIWETIEDRYKVTMQYLTEVDSFVHVVCF